MTSKSIVEAGRKAAVTTATYMTADVRHSAMKQGWDIETASNTNIMYDGTEVKVHIDAGFESQAMDLEYGTESSRPTAVLRKYGNRTQDAEKVFLSALSKGLGMKLT